MEIHNLLRNLVLMPYGADSDSEGDQSAEDSADGTESSTEAKQAAKPSGGAAKSGNESDSEDDDDYAGYTPKELKRALADLAKAKAESDKVVKAAEEEKELQARAKRDEVTNLTDDLSKANKTIDDLRAVVAKQSILGAIRDDSRFSWHKPEMVAEQLNSDLVKVSEDGKVEGLKAELTRISKEFPFLLKGEGSTAKGTAAKPSPTGYQPGQGGTSNGNGKETNIRRLEENYPSLASRS